MSTTARSSPRPLLTPESANSRKIYINGRLVPKEQATVSVFDHGLLYGDGVFEGLRSYGGKVFRLAEHIERLYDSARAIRLEIPLSREAFAAAHPDVAVFMPCGYGFDEAVDEGRALLGEPALTGVVHLFAADATAMFSRPGPRLVDGVEALAWALHPRAMHEPPPRTIVALR